MDIARQIDEQKRRLQDLKTKLEREIDTLYKEIDHVEQDTLGVMNRIKMLTAAQVARGVDTENLMGQAYARAKRGEFRDANHYIEHLRKSQEEARGAISEVNSIISNIEALGRDYSVFEDRMHVWMDKADRLIN